MWLLFLFDLYESDVTVICSGITWGVTKSNILMMTAVGNPS